MIHRRISECGFLVEELVEKGAETGTDFGNTTEENIKVKCYMWNSKGNFCFFNTSHALLFLQTVENVVRVMF